MPVSGGIFQLLTGVTLSIGVLCCRPSSVNADGGDAKPASKLAIQFDTSGLSSLAWGIDQLALNGQVEVARVKLGSRNAGKDELQHTDHFAIDTLTQKFSWGTITIKYLSTADRLAMQVELSNTGTNPVSDLTLNLAKMTFPTRPSGIDWQNHYGQTCDRSDALPVMLADMGGYRMAICNDDLSTPVKFAMHPLDGEPYELTFGFGSPIAPHAKRTGTISIRLAGDDHPGWSIADDVLQSFAALYPSELNWTDRRPIGSAFLATSQKGYKKNPRGWFLDPNVDTTTDEGRAAFHTRVMNYADSVIDHCKDMNAQGVIVWDLEGQEMPHATSYLADARVLSKVAPEMDSIANRFFKKFTQAGLRTGVTIRPTKVGRPLDGSQGWAQLDVKDPVAEMDDKITYAHKRWGCTVFYLDSNVNFVRDAKGKIIDDPAMAAEDFRTLERHHKDCLLIPEHKTAAYWAYTAPYSELRLGFTGTPAPMRQVYPHAFTVLQVVDGPALDSQPVIQELTAAINGGDILLFRPWWDDPSNDQIKQIYSQANKSTNTQ